MTGAKPATARTARLHPSPVTFPIAAGESLAGCSTPPEQLASLFEAANKYRSFKYWDKIRVYSSESRITGQGFNAVKFDPRKPARTIRRNDDNLGKYCAMHRSERRRFSLPELKRFASFPDEFRFAGDFQEGIRQVGDSVPPLFMRAIAGHIRFLVLPHVRRGDAAAWKAHVRQADYSSRWRDSDGCSACADGRVTSHFATSRECSGDRALFSVSIPKQIVSDSRPFNQVT